MMKLVAAAGRQTSLRRNSGGVIRNQTSGRGASSGRDHRRPRGCHRPDRATSHPQLRPYVRVAPYRVSGRTMRPLQLVILFLAVSGCSSLPEQEPVQLSSAAPDVSQRHTENSSRTTQFSSFVRRERYMLLTSTASAIVCRCQRFPEIIAPFAPLRSYSERNGRHLEALF
jgi:hypothetical protein